jgi:hypothetical protein
MLCEVLLALLSEAGPLGGNFDLFRAEIGHLVQEAIEVLDKCEGKLILALCDLRDCVLKRLHPFLRRAFDKKELCIWVCFERRLEHEVRHLDDDLTGGLGENERVWISQRKGKLSGAHTS